ncbi:MAG: hypothetical protein AAGU75_10665 [Bacillota bacterium]
MLYTSSLFLAATVAVGTVAVTAELDFKSNLTELLKEVKKEFLKGESNHLFGQDGTQVTSKTVWQNGKTERIDVENPAPGERPGQIHYHDAENNKWYYDPVNNEFYNQLTGELAPIKIQKLLNDSAVQKAINKALNILGE